ATGDNISLFDLNTWLPANYYEVSATVKVTNGGTQANGFIIFDYQSETNFKYAGIDVTHGTLVIGQRTASGWSDLATVSGKNSVIGANKNATLLLAVSNSTATISMGTGSNALSVSYAFAAPLNTGLLGVGSNNASASYSAYSVNRLPI